MRECPLCGVTMAEKVRAGMIIRTCLECGYQCAEPAEDDRQQ